jgi:hypothetical protein
MTEQYESPEAKYTAAFERLKAEKPKLLKKGTKLSQANVAKEAGDHPTALKKDRYPTLIMKIQDEIARRKTEAGSESDSHRQKRVSDKQRLKDCKAQRDKMHSIIASQETLIEELLDRIHQFENGRKVIPFDQS